MSLHSDSMCSIRSDHVNNAIDNEQAHQKEIHPLPQNQQLKITEELAEQQLNDSDDAPKRIQPFFADSETATSKRQHIPSKRKLSQNEISIIKSIDFQGTSAEDVPSEKTNPAFFPSFAEPPAIVFLAQDNPDQVQPKQRQETQEQLSIAQAANQNAAAALMQIPQELNCHSQLQHKQEFSRTLAQKDPKKQPNDSLEPTIKPSVLGPIGPQLVLNTDYALTETQLLPNINNHTSNINTNILNPAAHQSLRPADIDLPNRAAHQFLIRQSPSSRSLSSAQPNNNNNIHNNSNNNNSNNNEEVIVINGENENFEFPESLGFFQVRHMSYVLLSVLALLVLSSMFNLMILSVSIAGLIQISLQLNVCEKFRSLSLGYNIALSVLSLMIFFIDTGAFVVLRNREYIFLKIKDWNSMTLKMTDLQNFKSIIQAVYLKYPLIIKPQIPIKCCKVVIAFTLLFEIKDQINQFGDQCESLSGALRVSQISCLVIIFNFLWYVMFLIAIGLRRIIIMILEWKRRRAALNLKHIKDNEFFKFKNASQLGKCEAQCIICYMEYEVDDSLAKLPCQAKHIFHKECVSYWLEINQCCPICKQVI